MGVWGRRVGGEPAHKGDHLNDRAVVVVNEDRQRALDGNDTTEFLADFPDHGGRRGFARLDLAAGEFPFQRQVFVGRPLGQQDLCAALDHSADDGNGTGGGHARLFNKEFGRAATFPVMPCFQIMKTFLKIFLIVVLSLLAIKFIPLVALGAFVGLIIAAILGAVGLSLLAALLAVGVALALALSPIWIPVLIVMGAISLFKKLGDRPEPPVQTA